MDCTAKASCMTQSDLRLEPSVRIPPKGSQTYRLLLAMRNGQRLTVAKALNEHGCYALSQRCTDLRRMGWPIQSRTLKMPSGAHVSEYWLP